ncbi:hypothetical protein GLOIN_2v1844106 [Rhizophagus irregularis DAOM 181602=DAOM 197198]|nr:hypothetical protein GLOIN_2v1844106 [Rhizophagus irregularis DAOM 181602=DAOM 197198]
MPQSSPFVKTISGDIYKTWNGEAIINFKWNTFGKYYYLIIWATFMALLGCFTTAVTIPQQYIDKDVQVQLLIASIILGLIHLSFEIRQIIYNPIKWIRNFWNIFNTNFSFDNRVINNDPNNPWNIVPTYGKVLDDGTIDSNPYIIQLPNENTNIYYYANVDKTREEIKKLISDGQWDADVFSEMREDLLKKLNIQNYKTDQKLLKEIQEKQEADQKLLKEMQEKNETDQKLLKELQEKHENDQKLLKEIREILLNKTMI